MVDVEDQISVDIFRDSHNSCRQQQKALSAAQSKFF